MRVVPNGLFGFGRLSNDLRQFQRGWCFAALFAQLRELCFGENLFELDELVGFQSEEASVQVLNFAVQDVQVRVVHFLDFV